MERDMRKLDFEPQMFDAILFWGSLGHVHTEDILPMFKKAYVSFKCELNFLLLIYSMPQFD